MVDTETVLFSPAKNLSRKAGECLGSYHQMEHHTPGGRWKKLLQGSGDRHGPQRGWWGQSPHGLAFLLLLFLPRRGTMFE